jgi:hypothetical protein
MLRDAVRALMARHGDNYKNSQITPICAVRTAKPTNHAWAQNGG